MNEFYIKYMKKRNRKNDFISAIRDWKHVDGYNNRNIINRSLNLSASLPQVVEYTVNVPDKYALDGKTIFFFSDLHYDNRTADPDRYINIIERIQPEWIIFGGDLTTYACSIKSAFSWLTEISAKFADIPKIAVPGNWDRRRKRWFPQSVWSKNYKKCGFHWLINQEVLLDGIRFYGFDDSRFGVPAMDFDKINSEYFNCFISHSVEPVVEAFNHFELPGNNLVLCGHSHGGQVRIPFFGALLTSSKYWKFFEYGRYRNKSSDTEILMTSGIGTSRFPFRIFCPPEVVVIRFIGI